VITDYWRHDYNVWLLVTVLNTTSMLMIYRSSPGWPYHLPAFDSLQGCVESLQYWFWDNGLLLNPNKSAVAYFGTSRRFQCTTWPSAITLTGSSIRISDSLQILGVTVDYIEKLRTVYLKLYVRVQDLRFGTNVRVRVFPCGTYVNFYGLARVAIQGLTWVNF